MIWVQVVLPLILGLAVSPWQSVSAEEQAFILKGNNSGFGKPGNRSVNDNFLYMNFVCRDKANGLRIPIAGSCVDYYECQDGVARRMTCKDGLHFSNFGLACLDARLSKCTPEQMDASVNCRGMCCSREDGLYPAKDSCSDFVICLNGQTLQKSCGGTLQFSAENLICDIPERARCSSAIDKEIIDEEVPVPQSKPTMYVVSQRVCRNRADGENIPIFGSCNKFYLCIHGVGYLKSCGNLQFNPSKRYCDDRTRMYCPAIEEDDVILDEEEYLPGHIKPIPLSRPKQQSQSLRPIPLNVDEEEDEVEQVKPSRPAQKKPQKGKKPMPEKEQNVQERPQKPRPRPPVIDEEEEGEVGSNWNLWGKKPANRPPVNEVEAEEHRPDRPSNKRPQQGNKKPIPDEEQNLNERPENPRPRPPFTDEEEEEEVGSSWNPWGKKPANRPPVNEVEEKEEGRPDRPSNSRPQQGNKKPIPTPPISDRVPQPPHIAIPSDEEEDNVAAVASSNICAEQPVGALMAMPGDCTKYIRCRWDWFERRIAEEMICPQDMHFNPKSKYCDLPENAGCRAGNSNSKYKNEVSKKKNTFMKAL